MVERAMNTKKVERKTEKTALLQGILEVGLRVFRVNDVQSIAKELNISPKYALEIISRLVKEGWIEGIRKGLYKLSSKVTTSPIHEFEIAMGLVRPALISFYSAFYHHGLTEQIPRTVYITTIKRRAAFPLNANQKTGFVIEGINYRVVQLKKEKFFGASMERVGDSQCAISNLERTLIEGFAFPQYCGGFGEVMYGLEQSLSKLNPSRLIDYALRWNIAVARRVGWALDQLGYEDNRHLTLVQGSSLGYRLLDPSREAKGDYSTKWRLQINL